MAWFGAPSASVQIRRDDRRYEELTATGWRVLRLSAADLRHFDAVVARRLTLVRALSPTKAPVGQFSSRGAEGGQPAVVPVMFQLASRSAGTATRLVAP